MSEARHVLLGAIYDAITGDAEFGALLAGAKVYDAVPRGADHPFVVIGAVTSRALDGDDVPVVEHRVELFVHSAASGQGEASSIADGVRGLLDGASPTLEGQRLVSLRHLETGVSATRDGRGYRARLRFRALTEAI
ncbi:DUF3168 domain-containing protein [Acuticoccus kandeliae]|uniref:DUF3168 domain-containing protein n=1 Tax=Acuticoccus kandeliae TaxID=2073160 RepID=UPI000D3EE18E|nr:DUF3168 domain-containing protein [Acuticoccus kandeliae]